MAPKRMRQLFDVVTASAIHNPYFKAAVERSRIMSTPRDVKAYLYDSPPRDRSLDEPVEGSLRQTKFIPLPSSSPLHCRQKESGSVRYDCLAGVGQSIAIGVLRSARLAADGRGLVERAVTIPIQFYLQL